MLIMSQAFVIMQIGNSELDSIYENAIVPAILSCRLEPKRVDKHNEGRLLKSEIVHFIESSDTIIADLTNERPNCYLEVGYAMGLDKFRNLILTSREDHFHDSPNYKKDGPKIHFDLSGYDILFWKPDKLNEFKEELEKRITRRKATLIRPFPFSPWDEEWLSKQRELAFAGLKRIGHSGFMEINMTLLDFKPNIPQTELLTAANQAPIHTFGWPIGVVLNNRDEFRPRPTTDGIVAEIYLNEETSRTGRKSYDYWRIRRDGTFYLLMNLYEDNVQPGYIFFDTRIIRITEALLYCVRLYSYLNVPNDSRIFIGIRHGGLKNRIMSRSSGGIFTYDQKSLENEIYTEIETTSEKIESSLVDLVEKFTKPLFILFDFFEIDRRSLENIVNNFVAGKIN
jgi:hypothetical protein